MRPKTIYKTSLLLFLIGGAALAFLGCQGEFKVPEQSGSDTLIIIPIKSDSSGHPIMPRPKTDSSGHPIMPRPKDD